MDTFKVINNSIAILFTCNFLDIKKIKESSVDINASLLAELSKINEEIKDSINFNAQSICEGYIDNLIESVNKIKTQTLSNQSTSPLINFSNKIKDRVKFTDDKNLSEQLDSVKNKINSLIKHDVNKSVNINSVILSKSSDFIKSTKEQLLNLSQRSSTIIEKINEVTSLIEACDFCIYYINKNLTNTHSYVEVLEENRNTIITRLTNEYNDWQVKK